MSNEYKQMFKGYLLVLLGLAIFMLSFVVPHASADESIILGGISVHTASDNHTNSNHNVVALEGKNYVVGYMKNSYDNDSFIVGYKDTLDETGYFDVGYYAGAVRGYDKCFNDFNEKEKAKGKEKVAACPMLALYFDIKTGTVVRPQVTIFGDAIVLSAKYSF